MTGLDSVRRTAISPGCPKGRSFASELLAEKAVGKHAQGTPVEHGGHWHLKVPEKRTGPDARTRALVLRRDGNACAGCGVSVTGRSYSLQHRRPRGAGGTSDASANSPANLITLCGHATEPGSCHLRAEQRDPEYHARGYWLRSGEDPALRPVMLFSPGGSGITVWLSADGRYLTEAPEGAEAA